MVAEELARFVGGDRVERLKTLELFIRGGYQQTTGKAFEFPDSLRDVQDEYNLVTDDGLADNMNAYANQNGDPAAAEECQRLVTVVDRIHARIQACKEFNNNATKMEMLQQLVLNRVMLVRGVKGYGGDLQANNDPKIMAEYGDRLMRQCNDYFTEQTRLTKKMQNQETWTVSDRSAWPPPDQAARGSVPPLVGRLGAAARQLHGAQADVAGPAEPQAPGGTGGDVREEVQELTAWTIRAP